MTDREALERLRQMYRDSTTEDSDICLAEIFDELQETARDHTTPEAAEKAIQALAILAVFADHSQRAKVKDIWKNEEVFILKELLNISRHPNTELRRAAFRALSHIDRSISNGNV